MNSAAQLGEEDTLDVAARTYSIIDSAYVNVFHESTVNPYNLASYFATLEGKFQRIFGLSAQRSVDIAGLGNGLFPITVGSETVDTRNAATYPLLHALYTAPDPSFLKAVDQPNWIEWVPWALQAKTVLNTSTRKILDVGGADVFLMPKADYIGLTDQEKPALVDMTPAVPETGFGPQVVVKNSRSYGIAYLAKSIQYVNPQVVKAFNQAFVFPFPPPGANADLLSKVMRLRNILLDLDGKWSIVLESEKKAGTIRYAAPDSESNRVTIQGFIGNKAAFTVRCIKSPCVFVFNTAAISGWHAFAESKELPIERATFAFLSVRIPPGEHVVWFEYRPFYSSLANFISLFTLLIVLLFVLLAPRLALPSRAMDAEKPLGV